MEFCAISTELYEQFENFPNIDKVKLLKSQLQFMKKDDLCIKLKSIPRYFDLFEKGKIECTYFEIEDSDIIDLLCKETIVKKRKWKGKIFLYLEEQDELQLIGNY